MSCQIGEGSGRGQGRLSQGQPGESPGHVKVLFKNIASDIITDFIFPIYSLHSYAKVSYDYNEKFLMPLFYLPEWRVPMWRYCTTVNPTSTSYTYTRVVCCH